jgi:drug/metabolite transporter (DMT)-like permease
MPFRALGRLTHSQAVLLMVAATLMWAIAGVVTRQLESAARFEITFWRGAFAAVTLLCLLPVWRWQGRKALQLSPQTASAQHGWLHRHWGVLPRSKAYWISGVCWSVMFTAFMLALTFTSVANVLIIMSIGPLLTALIARVAIGQRLPARTWVAMVFAAMGIVYMYGRQFAQALADPSMGTSGLVVGSLIAVCVPLAGAVNWTVVQRGQTEGDRVDLVPAVLLGAVICSLCTLPLALPFSATAGDIAWLGLLGSVQLAIPCVLAMVCARVLKAPEVSLLALLEVIFGIVLAWVWAHEAPGAEVLLGGGVVMAALAVNELLGWRFRAGTPRIQTLDQQGR